MTCYFVLRGWVQVGAVLSIVQIGIGFYGSILSVAATVGYYGGTAGMRKRVFGVLNTPSDLAPPVELRFEDRIVIKNASFRYPEKDRLALDGIDITFEKNKKYLVLGKSGSGKSTLLKLIAKIYEVDSGEIFVDDRGYKDLREKDLSPIVAIAMQTCYLFNRSFESNIDYLGTGDRERLNYVIDFTALRDFSEKLPNGLDTFVNEEVNQVSGGEKLRINLARALYRESQILLLDEVTSALDKNTASHVESNLLSLKDKTLINVCHKFNDDTLPLYDSIFIMEDGKIVKAGSYFDLRDDVVLNKYRSIENKPEI